MNKLAALVIVGLIGTRPVALAGTTPSSTAGIAPMRAELLDKGPVMWLGTFISPAEVREVPLDIGGAVTAAAQAKFKFIAIEAKGQSGFCVWNDKNYNYTLSGVTTRDYLREFLVACKTQNILPGVQYAIPDAHMEGKPEWNKPVKPQYFNQIKRQITELLHLYPDFRFVFLCGANRLSKSQWTDLLQGISQVNSECFILCEPDTKAPEDSRVICGEMIKDSAGKVVIEYEKASVTDCYKHYSEILGKGHVGLVIVKPDKKTGGIGAQRLVALRQLKEMIERNPPPEKKEKPK